MGTVGLNFGSATSGAGFDVATTVTSILAISQGIETPWKNQLASLKAKDTALSSIGTDLSTLSTAVSTLTSFDGVLASKQGSSSDTDVLALTAASSSAIAGSHTIVVNSLAATSSEYSATLANKADTLSGSISIQIASGTAQTLTIDSTNNTLATLAQAINNGSYGVTASVVTDTTGSRLSIVSQTSGTAGQITLGGALTDTTAGTSLGFSVGQTGADASLTVDGLPTTSSSNTVTNAIPGVTFQLLSSPLNTSVQVQITNDNSSAETALQDVVTAYNKVVTDVSAQEANDATGTAEPLFGDPTLALIQAQLSQALQGGGASGSITNIEQLGITANADGSLTLNTSTLDAVLNSNYGDVVGFLQNSGSFGQNLSSTLNSLGSSSVTGAISLELAENSTTETGLNKDISDEEDRIATEKTTLTTELNTANQELQAIPEQLDEVNEVYSATTGYNTGK